MSKLTRLNGLKIVRLGAWASVVVALFVASTLAIGWWRLEGPITYQEPEAAAIAKLKRLIGLA